MSEIEKQFIEASLRFIDVLDQAPRVIVEVDEFGEDESEEEEEPSFAYTTAKIDLLNAQAALRREREAAKQEVA